MFLQKMCIRTRVSLIDKFKKYIGRQLKFLTKTTRSNKAIKFPMLHLPLFLIPYKNSRKHMSISHFILFQYQHVNLTTLVLTYYCCYCRCYIQSADFDMVLLKFFLFRHFRTQECGKSFLKSLYVNNRMIGV